MELTCTAPQIQSVKLYPASELKKVAIEIEQEAPLHLRCMNCGIGWSPRLNPNATVQLNYWVCPNSCNRD
jgi:hypothetical protein